MSDTELNLFKDEVLNEIREMEKKFLNELSQKNFEHTINYEAFSEKVNSILESNRLMIESITNQKIHFEKINKLEKETNKMDQNIITHEVRINNILNNINKMTSTYDKLISSNLIISGYIGPGCPFKSFADFVISSVTEFKNFKDEKENIKRLNSELKTKIDVIVKNLTNFIEFNANRCKSYTDSKEKDVNLKLENKFQLYDEKTIENNKKIFNKQIKFEEQLKDIGLEIDKFYDVKEDINSLIKQKFEKVNEKEEEINKRLINAIYEVKGLTEQMKLIYSKIENMDKNSNLKFEEQNKINQRIFKLSKSNNFNLYNNKNNNFEFKKITNEKIELSKKKGLPPNLIDSLTANNNNNITNIDKSKIFKNEKISSTLFPNLKPEDRKVETFNTEDKISNDISMKSLSNRKDKDIDYIRNIIEISVSRSSKKPTDLFPKRKISVNEIKEKRNKKNKSNIYINLKGNKKKIIFDSEVKDELTNIEHIDTNAQIKAKSKNKAAKKLVALNYENSYFVKTNNEFFKNAPKIMVNKETYTRYMSSNKNENKKEILKQRNKIDVDYKKEFIRNIKTENSIYDVTNKIQSSNRSINPIDCNLINLNLQDLPSNIKKNQNEDDDDSNHNLSFEFRQSKKKASKSNDTKNQIKVLPFGKTTNTFFKKK